MVCWMWPLILPYCRLALSCCCFWAIIHATWELKTKRLSINFLLMSVCVCVCVLERVYGKSLVFVCLLVVHVLVLLLKGCVWRFVAHAVNSHVPLLRAELLCIPQDSRDDVGWWHHYRSVRATLLIYPHRHITAATAALLWDRQKEKSVLP